MDIKRLKAEVFEDIKKDNEYQVKQSIKSIIGNIIKEQNIISEATKRMNEYKVTLKQFEAPEELSQSIIE